MDVGALRKVLKRSGHWRRLQDHVTMLSEAEGPPIGRALTPEEQKRLFDTAASNPEWEHVYCAAVLAANTSKRGVEVKHLRLKDVDLEKAWDVESAKGKGVLYVGHSKNETGKREIPLNPGPRRHHADAQARGRTRAYGPGALTRFEREARLLAALDHSNIGGIFGVIEESGDTRFLFLKLVESDTLAEAQAVIESWTRTRTTICQVT
jgi:integrase